MLGPSVPQTARQAVLRRPGCRLRCAGSPGAEAADGPLSFLVEAGVRQRLDAYLAGQIPDVSRGKVERAVRAGAVTVNGRPQLKPSFPVKAWDRVACELPPPAPVQAEPEDIPLAVVYEDGHLLVVDKAAGMVVHPSPGHERGTLVHALLHHCGLPAVRLSEDRQAAVALLGALSGDTGEEGAECEDDDGDELAPAASLSAAPAAEGREASSSPAQEPVLRPGIVHRLDKGTTGLLVVAKTEFAHVGLSEQFHARTVERRYRAIHLGTPKQPTGTVETNIGRDPNHRKHMATFAYQSSRGRHAVSSYTLLERLAGGAASLVEWKLQTGRTHQIRLHGKHLGHSVLGDDTYGGSGSPAAKLLGRIGLGRRGEAGFDRPALHAETLGFQHPVTRERLSFTSPLPPDFARVLAGLRGLEVPGPLASPAWQQQGWGAPLAPHPP